MKSLCHVVFFFAIYNKILFLTIQDMNEPSNFLSGSMYGHCEPEDLPYKPLTVAEEGLKHKTLCMDAKHYVGPHYDIHNLYAITEAVVTHALVIIYSLSILREPVIFIGIKMFWHTFTFNLLIISLYISI